MTMLNDLHAARPVRRSGFTLLEVLIVIWALGMLMFIGVGALVGAMKVEQAAGSAYLRLASRNALADQFRSDVAEATQAPDSVDKAKASATCLILSMADGGRVIYRWNNGELERLANNKMGSSRRPVPVGRSVTGVEFVREGDVGRIISLRISETRGSAKDQRQTTIVAALGGDSR
jgi:prepilin-type N-terminal cleavage/methylation domain-containing protein